MSNTVDIFYPALQQETNGQGSVRVEGKTVGECLNNLIRLYPGTEKKIFDDQHQLLKQVFVYVNAESISKVDMTRPVKDGDHLIIAVLISGG